MTHVSTASHGDMKPRRKAVRAQNLELGVPSFFITTNPAIADCKILTIAERGALLQKTKAASVFIPEAQISGQLKFGDMPPTEVTLRVVYVSQNEYVGVEFVSPAPGLKAIIRSIFEAELDGASMYLSEAQTWSEVPSGSQKFKFNGLPNNTLEVFVRDGFVTKFILSYHKLKGLLAWAESSATPPIRGEKTSNDEQVNTILKVIKNIDSLESNYKKQIEKALLDSVTK